MKQGYKKIPMPARYAINALLFAGFIILGLALINTGIVTKYYTKVLMLIGINIILAVSLNIATGYLGQLPLGHAGFMAVGAYTAAIFMTRSGLDPSVSFPIGLALGALAAGIVGAAGRRRRDHGDTRQSRAGADAERARHRLAQRVERGVAHVTVRHRHHHDGHLGQLLRGQRAGLVVHARGLDPAPQVLAQAHATGAPAALGERHLLGVGEVEGQVRGAGVAALGLGGGHPCTPDFRREFDGRDFGLASDSRHRFGPIRCCKSIALKTCVRQ